MAFVKTLVASMLLCLFVLHGVEALGSETNQNQATSNTLTGTTSEKGLAEAKIDCGAACAERCSETKRPNLCKRSCGSCCSKCSCVPPGTYGNYEACPCYASLTTRDKKHKCP